MNRRQLVAELRRLFEEEKRVQWRIGDLLVREVGPAGEDSANNGAFEQIEEIANDLGVSIGTLLKYRRMASTYAPATRVAGASFTAHEAASVSSDPAGVMKEAKRRADSKGTKLTVPLVREVAARYPKPGRTTDWFVEQRQVGGWGIDFTSAMDGATNNLKRLVVMLQGMAEDEELTDGTQRMLVRALDRCDQHIAWIRAYVRGENVADEATAFLQKQA
jgi:hypothetical protein